jgi:RNA polymerase sigma-70 factor (ECF subfamily)
VPNDENSRASLSSAGSLSGADTDRDLLNAHIAGDPDAFGTLVARHRDRLWAVALRTTGDPEEAADAMQDALISAFRRAEQFRGDSAVTTWLHRIVVNASLDRLRRRNVRSSVPLPEDDTLGTSAATATPIGRGGIPADPIEARETQLLIARALAELPQAQREAIVLVDVEGYSIEEAAQILDCPTGTVKSRCSRGRARLAESLGFLRSHPEGNQHPPPTVRAHEGEDSSGKTSTKASTKANGTDGGGEHGSQYS